MKVAQFKHLEYNFVTVNCEEYSDSKRYARVEAIQP